MRSLTAALFAPAVLAGVVSCGGGVDHAPPNSASAARASRPAATETFQSSTSKFSASQPPPRESGPARPPRTAALRFELRGKAFPLPLVHGTIGGEPVWMLVDTGANSHVIASWIAKKAGLAMKPLGDVGTDHAGRAVTTYSVDHPNMAIDQWGSLDDGPMLVTDIPEPIEKLGIGAFISPQWLGDGGDGVVLDFASKEIRSAPFDDAVKSLDGRGKPLVPKGGRICEDTGSAIKGLAFVLPASVDGNSVELLVDTGAHRTDLLTTAKAGRRLAPRSTPNKEQMYAASGLVQTRRVKGAQVKVGDYAITADIDLVPGTADPVCPRDGVVSMDVLKSCVLVLGRKQMLGSCQ